MPIASYKPLQNYVPGKTKELPSNITVQYSSHEGQQDMPVSPFRTRQGIDHQQVAVNPSTRRTVDLKSPIISGDTSADSIVDGQSRPIVNSGRNNHTTNAPLEKSVKHQPQNFVNTYTGQKIEQTEAPVFIQQYQAREVYQKHEHPDRDKQVISAEVISAPGEIIPTIQTVNQHMGQIVQQSVALKGDLDRDSLFTLLINELSPEEVRIKLQEDFEDVDHQKSEFMFDRFTGKLGKKYAGLLTDPSISTRMDEFIEFASSLIVASPEYSLTDLREEFREHLGTRRVYRAALLNEDEEKLIHEHGFKSALNRLSSFQYFLTHQTSLIIDQAVTKISSRAIGHQYSGMNEDSALISISDYPNMALYACTKPYDNKLEPYEDEYMLDYNVPRADTYEEKKLYLFPIDIHEFDVIRNNWYMRSGYTSANAYVRESEDRRIKEEISFFDEGMEGWVLLNIPPEDIKFDEMKTVKREDVPTYEIQGRMKNLDAVVNITEEIAEALLNLTQLEGVKLNSKTIELPTIGIVNMFSLHNMESTTGKPLWIGPVSQDPDNPQRSDAERLEQAIYVDSEIFYDKQAILKNLPQ